MKKLLDSDWLKARVQFKCNTSGKSVTPVQITHRNSDYELLKNNGKFSKPIISSETIIRSFYTNFEKSFLECEKMAFGKIFRHLLHANFFMFDILLISNHRFFPRSI